MNDQSYKREERERAVPGYRSLKKYEGKRIRDRLVFVTRDREPENCRVRNSDKTRDRGSRSGGPSPNLIGPL
jgi:hypothetical protein